MTFRNPMLAKVHIAKKELGLDDETYRAVLQRVTGKKSSKDCNDFQIEAVLKEFKRLGWKPKKGGPARKPSSKPMVRKVFAIYKDMVSKGFVDANGLRAFVKRMTELDDPEWMDTKQAQKVIEGLKAWQAREMAKRGAA